ncbi:MAG TPA: ATP-binding cassette domain-containing protein, partial [Actinomycetota bacterium]|nr:ATP-binding cassette domain-containing protein [Actinomycetota bacterium]
MTDMIRTAGLTKRFGDVTALEGLDLVVPKGTVLGLLGPNGAGKTTAVRILTTLLDPDEGTVEIAGLDAMREPEKVREKIGLSGQSAAVDEHLSGFENLEMVGRLYGLDRRRAKVRASQLMERFDLAFAGKRMSKTYSGGMKRRLDLAAALVAEPEVLFLDEPTTGLDPRSRLALWDEIRTLVRGGSTLLLTTQYLEEADRLADDIVVIDRGRMIAHGTADELKAKVGGERIEMVLASPEDEGVVRRILEKLSDEEVQYDPDARRFTAAVPDGQEALRTALTALKRSKTEVRDVGFRRPTMDDVFLTLTGHHVDGDAPVTEQEAA